MNIEYVVWRDSVSFNGWVSKDEEFTSQSISSVGYIIKDTDDDLIMSANIAENQYGDVWVIPKSAIIFRRDVVIQLNE